MKRKTAIVLALFMCFAESAGAADVKIADKGASITVEEYFDSADDAMLIVMKAGENIDNVNEMYAIKYASVKDGKAVWTFGMPEKQNEVLTDGEYDLYMKQKGEVIYCDKMVYASVESRTRVLDELSGISASEELLNVLNGENNRYALIALGFNMDLYDKSDKNNVVELTYNALIEGWELPKCFNLSIAVDGISGADNADEYLMSVNPVFEDTAFNDIKDEKLLEWICDVMSENKYTDNEDITDTYKLANILYIINNSRVQVIEDNLKKYADSMGIDSSDEYEKYRVLKDKDDVNKAICSELKKNPAHNTDDVIDIIDDAVRGNKKTTSSSKGGSGGSGGGGSSKTGIAVSVPVADEKNAEALPEVKPTVFADMKEASWAESAVNAMTKSGIISGDEKGNFRPNDLMTREEFVKMLVLASGLHNSNAKCDFDDTLENKWYYSYIASAVENGIVKGLDENNFGIGKNLTRQDMAVLCRRCVNELERKNETTQFADDSEISEYAKDAVYELCSAGIISGMGDGMFKPQEFATRAQGAMIIYNLLLK